MEDISETIEAKALILVHKPSSIADLVAETENGMSMSIENTMLKSFLRSLLTAIKNLENDQ